MMREDIYGIFLSNVKWKMIEKHYFCIHILHILLKEIRKPYELDYSDCCRIL